MAPEAVDGALAWDFLAAFFASRRAFTSIFRRYEARVLRFAKEAGVHRDDLVLPPTDLARLFFPKRLQHLRDVRLAALREFAHGLFREAGVVEPLDTTCSHAFHEISILLEEHQSVVRFQHLTDPRRYQQVFEEVSGYYPTRLRRIRKLFADGLRRVEELLPSWGARPRRRAQPLPLRRPHPAGRLRGGGPRGPVRAHVPVGRGRAGLPRGGEVLPGLGLPPRGARRAGAQRPGRPPDEAAAATGEAPRQRLRASRPDDCSEACPSLPERRRSRADPGGPPRA